MGERKGQNKYYPPDFDPATHGNLNAYHGTHALRERARKRHEGIFIIRFEMPYNIWCTGCNNHIGMGVRYNAEKTRAGNYYSTPVFKFRMKCHLCDNHFEIQTDPKNFDYEILSGARRQERRYEPAQYDQIAHDREESHKISTDPMRALEKGLDDKTVARENKSQICSILNVQEDRHKDDYASNSQLRKLFRTEKNEIKASEAADEKLLVQHSLSNSGIKILPPNDDDKHMAKLLSLEHASANEIEKRKRESLLLTPMQIKKKRKSNTASKPSASASLVSAGTSKGLSSSPRQPPSPLETLKGKLKIGMAFNNF